MLKDKLVEFISGAVNCGFTTQDPMISGAVNGGLTTQTKTPARISATAERLTDPP